MSPEATFAAAARSAVCAAWSSLGPVEAALRDGAGGLVPAQEALALHLVEVLQAEAWLRAAGGRAPAPEGPVAAALAHFELSAECRAAARLAPLAGPAAERAEALFAGSFSQRATKRRGGVYTRRNLVERLLDLSRWAEPGGPETLWEPAVGAGAFLVRAWERALDAGYAPEVLRGRLSGNDLHPFAAHAARFALALAAHERGLSLELVPKVSCGDALSPEAWPERPVELVLGNPPWVRGERIPQALRASYRERFPEVSHGNSDLASYFVAAAWRCLTPAGRLAFVLSQGVMDARSTAGLRESLGPGLEALVGLEWGPQPFPGANVIPALVVACRAPSAAPIRLGLAAPSAPGLAGKRSGAKRSGAKSRAKSSGAKRSGSEQPAAEAQALEAPWSWCEVPRERWRALGHARWAIHLRDPDLDLLSALRVAPRGLKAGYGLAVRTRVGAQELIAEGAAPPAHFGSPRPLRDGRDVVAWAAEPIRRWIDYRPDAISDPKGPEFFAGPKVFLPRIALTPQAFVDASDALGRNTLMVVRGPLEPDALAAVINGLPLRYYAFHLLRAGVLAASHRSTHYVGSIEDFPLPRAALEDSGLAARLAGAGRACARLAAEGSAELEAEERALDELLAEAYGLRPAELEALRRRAGEQPLVEVLRPTRLGDRRRKIGVQGFRPGARYR